MPNLTFTGTKQSPSFELVYYPKDKKGNPLPTARSIATDNAAKISDTWDFNNPRSKRKRRKKKAGENKRYKEVMPKGKEADRLLKEASNYAEKKQQERDDK